jgi:hypothetical protein
MIASYYTYGAGKGGDGLFRRIAVSIDKSQRTTELMGYPIERRVALQCVDKAIKHQNTPAYNHLKRAWLDFSTAIDDGLVLA